MLPRLEAAREEAARSGRGARAGGEAPGPLHGVPFTAKDPIPVAGMRSPNGSKLLADYVCNEDAEVVRRMRAAGAILLGKTNVSEFAAWWDSVNPLFGATANPHDPSRTAGGSSGGEAAALAAGMSPLGLGSDLGGSIRNPCHFVGVFGLKPGRDTVPFAEHAPLPMSPGIRLMAVTGPMARYVDDLELALDVLAPRTLPAEPPGADRGLRGRRAAAGEPRLPRGGAPGRRRAGRRRLSSSPTRRRRTRLRSARPTTWSSVLS